MTDERYKKIMADLGMPNSRSLLVALQQVANEAGQERAAIEREACLGSLEIVLLMAKNGNYSGQEEAVQECLFALQERSNAIELTGAASPRPNDRRE